MSCTLVGRTSLLSFALLSCAVGCGGEDVGRPVFEPAGTIVEEDPCLAREGFEFSIIEDFEPRPGGTLGNAPSLNVNNDPHDQGIPAVKKRTLPEDDNAPTSEPIEGGRCGESDWALRYVAEDICQWASMSQTLVASTEMAHDAREWDGIALWVRISEEPLVPEPIGRGIRVGVRDTFTVARERVEDPAYCDFAPTPENPDGNRQNPDPEPLFCPPSEPCPTPGEVDGDLRQMCCDPFGLSVGMTESWRLWKVPFAAMRQGGYGSPRDALSVDALERVELSLGPGNYDFWLDDIAYYRELR